MRYSPHLLDEIRARLPVSQVVGRKVALKKKGREFAGLSPFKSEKTPSFFVNDQKGFYHCFASGEHGDIFTFLMKFEGLAFPEAVERLAEEAGVALPKKTEHDQQRENEMDRLYRLVALSAEFFAEQLQLGVGRAARAYLTKRGLKDETIARFKVGYAPANRHALSEYLRAAGFSADEMAVSGMLIAGPDIREPYDRFRDRVMFPIADLKGRVIAFGGRALSADVPAKYLNSPETPLFHKGRILFNAAGARQAGFERQRMVAVEGYMDVIALAEAGFDETVAPLGTALTADQIGLLWRVVDEPTLCFDGDSAGRKAAYRAVETALPLLSPGKSLKFAFLPDGKDPDDLVREAGRDALEAVLQRAKPLADVLFERTWSQGDWSTPERRAQLEKMLFAHVGGISDETVRTHYNRDMRDRLYHAFRAQRYQGAGQGYGSGSYRGAGARASAGSQGGRRGDGGRSGGAGGRDRPYASKGAHTGGGAGGGPRFTSASDALRKSSLGATASTLVPTREALLLRTLINHPWLIEGHAEEISGLEITSEPLMRLRDAILSAQAVDNSLDTSGLRSQLTLSSAHKLVDLVDSAATHRSDRFAEPGAAHDEVMIGWCHALRLHRRQVELQQALRAADRAWHTDGSEQSLARICDLQNQLARAGTADDEDAPEPGEQTGVGASVAVRS